MFHVKFWVFPGLAFLCESDCALRSTVCLLACVFPENLHIKLSMLFFRLVKVFRFHRQMLLGVNVLFQKLRGWVTMPNRPFVGFIFAKLFQTITVSIARSLVPVLSAPVSFDRIAKTRQA